MEVKEDPHSSNEAHSPPSPQEHHTKQREHQPCGSIGRRESKIVPPSPRRVKNGTFQDHFCVLPWSIHRRAHYSAGPSQPLYFSIHLGTWRELTFFIDTCIFNISLSLSAAKKFLLHTTLIHVSVCLFGTFSPQKERSHHHLEKRLPRHGTLACTSGPCRILQPRNK